MSLKEIARLTGASTATVSRVLNNPTYHCQDNALTERIRQTARDLNYVPNASARQLKMGNGAEAQTVSHYVIDILLTRFDSLDSDSFFQEMFRYVEAEFHKQGCMVGKILHVPDISHMTAGKTRPHADGLLILGKSPADLVDDLHRLYPALLAIDRNPTDHQMDEVICRGKQAAALAVEYLLSLGHKKIAYIGDCNQEARYIGYYECLLTHKIPLLYDYVFSTHQTREEGEQVFQHIIKLPHPPTAVFCANDTSAIGFLHAMKQYNGRKRKNLFLPAIVSIDDIEEAALVSPSLTTVHIPKEAMAHLAVLTMRDRLQGGHRIFTRTELPCHLVVRESSGMSVERGGEV